MNSTNTIETLTALAAQLDALLPFGHCVELEVRKYDDRRAVRASIYGIKSYDDATEIFRALGIQKRDKSVWNDHEPRTVLVGHLSEHVQVTVYCSGLPPSCRLETVTERIPKKLVKEEETGEFVTVERTRVVCGNGEAA